MLQRFQRKLAPDSNIVLRAFLIIESADDMQLVAIGYEVEQLLNYRLISSVDCRQSNQ